MRESFLEYYIYKKVHKRTHKILEDVERQEKIIRIANVRKYRSIYRLLEDEDKESFMKWLKENNYKFTEEEIKFITQ